MITINLTSFVAGFIVGACVFAFCVLFETFKPDSMWNKGFYDGFEAREIMDRLIRFYDEHNKPKEG